MNNISKTIGWADMSWNPIKGLCPVGCWYCYARKIYKRFHLDPERWLDMGELNELRRTNKTGKRIFVCSTFDLFHSVTWVITGRYKDGIYRPARDLIFDVIENRPDLTFIILTKLPERIDRPMPKNVWLGVTVETGSEWRRAKELIIYHKAAVKFISFEPIKEFKLATGLYIEKVTIDLATVTEEGGKKEAFVYFVKLEVRL